MNIREFTDLEKLQKVQDTFSDATGLAAITIDTDGKYLTKGSNFTDFCMKYTRGSEEGKRRCERCDATGTGIYDCHAGLMDFAIDIIVDDEKVASVIGGQALPKEPNEEAFRATAEELGIDPDTYIAALKKVPYSSEKQIKAAATLFADMVTQFVNLEYTKTSGNSKLNDLSAEITHATKTIDTINTNTHSLKSIANKQKMLSLNASIEAARSGEAGVGFAVVAKSMGDLSSQSATIYGDIENSVDEVTASIEHLASIFNEEND